MFKIYILEVKFGFLVVTSMNFFTKVGADPDLDPESFLKNSTIMRWKKVDLLPHTPVTTYESEIRIVRKLDDVTTSVNVFTKTQSTKMIQMFEYHGYIEAFWVSRVFCSPMQLKKKKTCNLAP